MVDMTDLLLSATYSVARAAFLSAAERAGARVVSTPHPLLGPDDEPLAVDVAELGPDDADTVVVVVSATHGVEGYCGSALQTHWLAHRAHERPRAARLVHVHALNPFGMAWVRRVNEDNVDLNRNFVDWSKPLPTNADYDGIAHLIVPTEWTEAEQQRTTLELLALAEQWGFQRLQAVVSGGQYTNPTGVFYGGTEPVWSNRWLQRFAGSAFRAARRVIVIDLHTGLGPWGVGELIASESKGAPHHDRAAALWGDITSMLDGDSVSAPLAGDWMAAVGQLFPGVDVTPIALEYGTVDPVSVLQALRADAWLHSHGDPRGADAPAVRATVRAAFADDDPAWIAGCWERFVEVLGAALGV
jgi:hypothetical protein